MTTTTTKQGDTWDILAKTLYGSEMYMDILINANIAHRKTVIFHAGVKLNVPDIDTDAVTVDEDLPIWKRTVNA